MAKSLGEWENTAFTKIFEFQIDEDNSNIQTLSSLRHELIEEGAQAPFLLTKETLDRALVSYLETFGGKSNNGAYLYKCYKKANEIQNNLQLKGAKNLPPEVVEERINSIKYSKELIVSYFGLSIIFLDMFPSGESAAVQWFINTLLEHPLSDDPNSIDESLLDAIIVRFQGDGLDEFIKQVFDCINQGLYNITTTKNYRPYFKIIYRFLSKSSIAEELIKIEGFLPENEVQANEIESKILLGPLLRLSTYPDGTNPVHKEYFFNSQGLISTDLSSIFYTLRSINHEVVNTLFEIFDKLIRASTEVREKVLELFSIILKKNSKKSGIQVDATKVSSDRFLNNVTLLLLRFSQPFIDANHSKIHKIDINYYLKSNLTSIQDEASIAATKEEYELYLRGFDPNENPNFISHVFHLNLLAFHLGILRSISTYKDICSRLEDMEEQLEKLELTTNIQSNSTTYKFNEMLIKRFRDKVEQTKAYKNALETYILDDDLLRKILSFYELLMAYLLRCLDPTHGYPINNSNLNLPLYKIGDKPADEFRMLPEYYIYDLIEFFLFVSQECPEVMLDSSCHDLISFITTLLYHQDSVNNPYLKIKLVEILFFLTFPLRQQHEGILGPAMNSNPIALNNLLPSLLKFYVTVEQTGLSSQFHDKFNVRYNITQLLKKLWKNPTHQIQMGKLTKDGDFFVKFVNLLMNDTTYLLDESIFKLTEIHDIQCEMEDLTKWNQQTPEYKQERENLLKSDERMAKSYVALSNENVYLLSYVTETLPQPFLSSEIITRLAAMLNYTLSSLVGPKCTQLKVKEPKKYNFQPRALLSQLLRIYLNLNQPEFVSALAEDGRSYSKDLYLRAIQVVTKHNLLETSMINEFTKLMNNVESEYQKKKEEVLEDVPEEFLDPLMFTVMKEPVTLPSSGMVVDLSTIKAHLLSDSTDPFNRQPLKLDDIIPNLELKQKILDYFNNKSN